MNTDKIYAEHIANEYSAKKESKVIALKKLDRKAKLPADIFVYTNGIIMSLILGLGMSLSMNVIGNGKFTVLGIVIGIFGIIGVSTNYFSYKKILKNSKEKYAQDIINIGNSSIVNGIGNFVKTKKIGIAGLNDGTLLEKMFNELATRKKMKTVADIKMPLVIPAVDIAEAKEYIFTNCAPRNNVNDEYITEISIGKAIRASSSFPAYFCPCEYKKHIFMDGGVLDNTPILPLKRICKHKVMAVNFEADPVEENCDVMDIIMKTLDIMGNKIAEESFKQSDLVLTVPTDRAGLFDIEKMDKCYKFGYDTTMKNIDKIKKLIY